MADQPSSPAPSAAPSSSPAPAPAPASPATSSAAANPQATPAADSPAAPAAHPAGPAELVTQILTLVNAARQKAGLRPVRLCEALCWASQEHAEDMSRKNYFQYQGPDGVHINKRIERIGYTGETGVDLSRGRTDPQEVVTAWLENEQTRQSLLSAGYRDLGVGVDNGYWALVLGTPVLRITPQMQEAVRNELNRERSAAGAPPLELEPTLNYAAQRHSQDMAIRNYFDRVRA